MKRRVGRSLRIFGRKFTQVRYAASNILRSNSYHPSTHTSIARSPPSSDTEDDDGVFEALPAFESSQDVARRESVVLIPCEFCHSQHSSGHLNSHQLLCDQNPSRRQRTRLNPRSSTRNPRRTVSESVPPGSTIASAPPHAPSHARSPSPTEGFPIPDDLACPITGTLFCDPVVASDGHTYEKTAIMKWLQKNDKSPVTREKLLIDKLHPNRIIKKIADDFRADCQRKRSLYKYKIDIDLKKTEQLPFIQKNNRSIYHAEWIQNNTSSADSNILLIHLIGDKAEKLAEINSRLEPHTNIVRIFGRVEHNGAGILLVQESTPPNTLSQLMANNDQKLSIKVLDIIFYQIVSALQHFADAGITHRHLTADNVFIYHLNDIPENTLVKLTNIIETEGATSNIAPELLSDNLYSEKSDVYALGILARDMYSLELPTDNDEEKFSERQILFERCILTDPNERPTFNQLTIDINHLIHGETSFE